MTISYRQHDTRSLLFVPADDDRKMKRAMLCGADAVIFDLEDSISPEKKSRARSNCTTNDFSTSDTTFRLVRINPPGTEWFEDDLKALSEIRPDGVVLPKCETVDGVRAVANKCQAHHWTQSLGLYLTIESPLGLIRAEQIAAASDHVVAMAFGAEDFCAAMGIDRTSGEPELMPARCTIVTVAKAFDLAAIDSPTVVLDNVEDVRSDAVRARRSGFTGKFAIHPQQVPILNMAFNPSPEQVQLAREMLEKAEGRSAFRWNGRMVDEAMLRRARQILEISKSLRTGDL
jgi:citrate lyase subunit beta / citryl-CoA lyase